MRTHVKNPLIYPNNPFNINKTTEQQVDFKTVYLNHFGNSVWYYLNMIYFNKNLAFLLLLLTKNSAPDQVKGQLKQLPDGRYYKPGRSCGILNSIKLLPNIPEKVDEIEGCTIIDLSLASPSTIPESGKVVYYVRPVLCISVFWKLKSNVMTDCLWLFF